MIASISGDDFGFVVLGNGNVAVGCVRLRPRRYRKVVIKSNRQGINLI